MAEQNGNGSGAHLTIGEFNYATLKMDRLPIPDAVAQAFLDFMFEKKRWHENVNLVHQKVRDVRQAVRAAQQASVAPPPAATMAVVDDWKQRAFALRHPAVGAPRSWRDIAKTLDRPVTSVRHAVGALEDVTVGVSA